MDARCDATRNVGKWSGCSPGCTTSADSSPDGNITSRTSSASSTSPACRCYSGIYETASRPSNIFPREREAYRYHKRRRRAAVLGELRTNRARRFLNSSYATDSSVAGAAALVKDQDALLKRILKKSEKQIPLGLKCGRENSAILDRPESLSHFRRHSDGLGGLRAGLSFPRPCVAGYRAVRTIVAAQSNSHA